MPETDTQPTINLLKDEVESWKRFIDALRAEDRDIARPMFEGCWRFASAIESSKKKYLTEPLFLTILLNQEEKISWLESELKVLQEEVNVWKSKAGY